MNKFKRWIEGIKNLTPVQQLHAKMVGHLGTIFGTAFGTVFLIWKGMWYFIILLIFVIFLQIVDYIGTRQQYVAAVAMEKLLKEQEAQVQSSTN